MVKDPLDGLRNLVLNVHILFASTERQFTRDDAGSKLLTVVELSY